MMYEKCKKCKYRCTCCASRKDWNNCSGCDRYDEFKPAENIIYCPLNGDKLSTVEEKKMLNLMDYIIERISDYCIKYERIGHSALRVYGNFEGFSSVRVAYEGWVEVDGKLIDYVDFEEWLYSISF